MSNTSTNNNTSSMTSSIIFPSLVVIPLAYLVLNTNFPRYVRRAYYTIKAIMDRHKPLEDSVWEEKDVEVLLMKVISKTSRSMGVTFMMWPERQYKATLFAYLYFRVVDTLADDIQGDHATKQSALQQLKDRLSVMKTKGESPGVFDIASYEILELTQKQKSYKLIVQNLHRFDPLWFAMSASDQQIVYDYCIQLIDGNFRLIDLNGTNRLNEECWTAIEIGLVYGFLPVFNLQDIANHIRDGTSNKEGKAWKSWAMAICLGQWLSTIEEDLQEGMCFDDALLNMLGENNPNYDVEVVKQVRTKHLRLGLQHYTQTLPFFHYEPVMAPIGLRLMFLQFTVVALNVYERGLMKIDVLPPKKFNVWWVMIKSTIQSVLSVEWYKQSIQAEIDRAQQLLNLMPPEKAQQEMTKTEETTKEQGQQKQPTINDDADDSKEQKEGPTIVNDN